ncbi:MAG: hypothetical protein WB774_13945 [Xanthobacteraceae bacterium]
MGIVGIEPHRFVGVAERFVEPAHGPVGVGALAECPLVFRIERDGAIEIGQRKLRFVDVAINRAAVDQSRGECCGLIGERVDQRAAGLDAPLRRIGIVVGRGADAGIGDAGCLCLCLSLGRTRGQKASEATEQTGGGESGTCAAHASECGGAG